MQVTDLQLKNNAAAHDLDLANSEVKRLNKEKADILKDMEPLKQAISDGKTLEMQNAQLKGELDKLGNGILKVSSEDRNDYLRISDTIEENKKNEYETISYFGSYEQLLTSLFRDGELSYLSTPRFPDYPDYGDVRKCINIEFNSYF